VYEDDLEFLRTWRNDTELTKYLSNLDYITQDKQLKWYEQDIKETDCYTFAIEETELLKRIVGSVALYNLNKQTSEFGRIIIGDKEARGKGMGFLATVLCLYLGFTEIGLERIMANVHEDNAVAIKAYKRAGFKICGQHVYEYGGYELEIAITKVDFSKVHDFLSKITVQCEGGSI